MPIRLITDVEKLSCEISGATVSYRRMPSHVQQKIEHKHTRRGQTDQRAVLEDVLQYCVQGWEGVVDQDGQAVAFTPELLKYWPEEAKGALVAHLYESEPPEDVLGN